MEKGRDVLLHLAAALFVLLFICTISVPVRAEEPSFLTRDCHAYSSPKAFVKKAVVSCLQSSQSRRCERSAEQYFAQCRFSGDYRALSSKIHSELLTVIVLQSASSLKAPAERKKL